MPLTKLLRYLANGEVVDQIANTPVVRRCAQLTHYVYQQGMNKLKDASKVTYDKDHETLKHSTRFSSFGRTFARNLQKEIEKEMKK